MKNVFRVAALAALSCSAVHAAAPPPPAPAPAKAPAVTEFPLSCNPAAKALVFKGWDLGNNLRTDEARETFKQAVAADPKCVVARAELAAYTPGAEGKKLFEETLTQTAGLNALEKLTLESTAASRAGDPEKAFALAQKLRDLAPGVFQLQLNVAGQAQGLNKWDESAAAAKKASELNPKSGAAWNMAGYASLALHRNADAVAAFRKYVELAPTEPNAHDSLADALLSDNQLDEAAAEYQKAIDSSGGKFFTSWSGIATVKAIKGDWDGARAALAKHKEGAVEAYEKTRTTRYEAWTWAAQGKLADAFKRLDAAAKESAAAKEKDIWGVAVTPVVRGLIHNASGKYADALKAFAAAEKVKVDGLNEGESRELAALRVTGVAEAQARLGKTAEAEKAIAALEALYQATPGNPGGLDRLAYSRGLLALAKKDFKGAVESFKKCSEPHDFCALARAEAQDKAGDAAGATETRTALMKANRRDFNYWFIRAQLDAKAKAPGKQVATEAVKK